MGTVASWSHQKRVTTVTSPRHTSLNRTSTLFPSLPRPSLQSPDFRRQWLHHSDLWAFSLAWTPRLQMASAIHVLSANLPAYSNAENWLM